MSLLFGVLTQDFVNFTNAIQNISPNDPDSLTKVNEAAIHFRHVAANNASYLTYIGAWILPPRLFPSFHRLSTPLQAWVCSSALTFT